MLFKEVGLLLMMAIHAIVPMCLLNNPDMSNMTKDNSNTDFIEDPLLDHIMKYLLHITLKISCTVPRRLNL